MRVTASGHWGGDPAVYCEQLIVEADDAEMQNLAVLNRVLSDPEKRQRLLELAQRIEAEDEAVLIGC